MRNDVRKLTLCAVLTAAALVTFVIELQLPPLTGIPGIKPGLANIFTLFTLCWLGRGWAFALMMVRVVLGCLITGRMTALGYSLVGGALAYLVMAALLYVISERQLWVVSMFGAMAHNLGQMLVARFVAGVAAIWYYLPVLLLSALITGLFTGLCAQLVLKRLRRGPEGKRRGNPLERSAWHPHSGAQEHVGHEGGKAAAAAVGRDPDGDAHRRAGQTGRQGRRPRQDRPAHRRGGRLRLRADLREHLRHGQKDRRHDELDGPLDAVRRN